MKNLLATILLLSSVITNAQIKVVGYLPTYRWDKLALLDYKHLTHVCAAFANPDDNGNLSFGKDLGEFVATVHSKGASAIISIGGGGDYSWGDKYKVYEKLFETPESRTDFITKIMAYVRVNKLDGVDNDLEGKALELANYNVFSQELADSLHASGLEFSAALGVGGQWGVDLLSMETMEKYDFIMTMSYGGVGSWNWSQKPDDGTYDEMVKDINHITGKGYDKTRTLGGIPFYTVEFPAKEQSSYWQYNASSCDTYSKYAKQDPWNQDTLTSSEGNPIYLNSLATYYKKLDVAIENNSGFMIWEVGQDCFDGGKSIMGYLGKYLDEKNVQMDVSALLRHVSIDSDSEELKIQTQGLGVKEISILDSAGIEISTSKKRSLKVVKSKVGKGKFKAVIKLGVNKVIEKEFIIL